MPSPKRTLHWVVAGFIVFNMVLLFLVVQPAQTPPVLLPDGSMIQVEQLSYGTNHFSGSALARAVHHAPSGVQGLLKKVFGQKVAPYSEFSTQTPSLIVFFKHIRGTNLYHTLPIYLSMTRVVLATGDSVPAGQNVGFGEHVGLALLPNPAFVSFENFPRRAATIQMLFLEPNSTNSPKMIAAIRVPNPIHKKYPTWKPEPLPAFRRSGDLVFTLQSFTSHPTNLLSNMPPAFQFAYNAWTPLDRLGCSGFSLKLPPSDPKTFWRFTGLTIEDPTGNSVSPFVRETVIDTNNVLHCVFLPSLWPDEPAWKLRLKLESYRIGNDANYDESEFAFEFLVSPSR